jgi:hypothetical protein
MVFWNTSHFLLLEHESLLARIKLRHFMFLDNFPKRLKSGYEGTPSKITVVAPFNKVQV